MPLKISKIHNHVSVNFSLPSPFKLFLIISKLLRRLHLKMSEFFYNKLTKQIIRQVYTLKFLVNNSGTTILLFVSFKFKNFNQLQNSAHRHLLMAVGEVQRKVESSMIVTTQCIKLAYIIEIQQKYVYKRNFVTIQAENLICQHTSMSTVWLRHAVGIFGICSCSLPTHIKQ